MHNVLSFFNMCERVNLIQKQPFADVLQNRYLKNFANFIGKNLSRRLFNKVAGPQASNFIQK